MKKSLSQKQKIILIVGYCTLVLILAVAFIQTKRNKTGETRPTEEIEEYLNLKEENESESTIAGKIEFLPNSIPEIPINLPVYESNESKDLNIAEIFNASLKKDYEYYKEYENDKWVIVEEIDVSTYTIGSKLYNAESEIVDIAPESTVIPIAENFIKEQLSLDINYEDLECSVNNRTNDYQFICSLKVGSYDVFMDFGNLTPLTVNINSDLQVYFAQILYLETIDPTITDSVNLLTEEEILTLTIDDLNKLGKYSLLSESDANPTDIGDHAHPTGFTGTIQSTEIEKVQVAYQKISESKEKAIVPIFIFTGEAITDDDETIYISIIYPATNPVQEVKAD